MQRITRFERIKESVKVHPGKFGWLLSITIAGLTCFLLCVWFYSIDGASLEQGSERAQDILAALQEYKQETGRYPSNLDSLVPRYLSTTPRPAWRYHYTYEVCSDRENYRIYFRQSGDADNYCGYSSRAGMWKCTDSLPPFTHTDEYFCSDSEYIP